MADTKVYHVTKREKDNKWAVKGVGSEKVLRLFDTKAEAEEYCKVLGKNQSGTILFHASKGEKAGKIHTAKKNK